MIPELTLSLYRREPAVYAARLRLRTGAEDEGDRSIDGTVRLDPDALNQHWANPDKYGEVLTEAVFADPKLRTAWSEARAAAGVPVRVRLELEEYALELHRVRWETLRDPVAGGRLLTDQGVWFSRYLHSFEMRRLRPRARTAARILLAVAAPDNLTDLTGTGRTFRPEDVFQVDAEITALTGHLNQWTREVTSLPHPDRGPPTLRRIVDHLRTGTGYDVLYLVAHGALPATGPKLLLVDDGGKGVVTEAADFVDELRRLRFPPRLVVLSSCQSAGPDVGFRADRSLGQLDAALGPQLGKAGIPAVVAMLGDVRQSTAGTFIRTFFAHLHGGQVDQAAAEARQAVADAPDHWAPVLYTRLTTGRLWRDPAAGADRFDQWNGLVKQLRNGRCIPVLGSRLLEPLVGSTQGIADRLLASQSWSPSAGPVDLPQAAQFIAATSQGMVLRTDYLDALTEELRGQFRDLPGDADLGPGAPPQAEPDPLRDKALAVRHLLAAAADRIAANHPPEPHDILARLPCPIYLSTNPDDLLGRALSRTSGKLPAVRVCNWLFPGPGKDEPPGAAPEGPDTPTADRPLVYHLFGHLSQPYSIVLSEDDYFKFLVGMSLKHAATKNMTHTTQEPLHINAKLAQSSLLFLGFRLDDWDFRAFLHFFMSQDAARSRRLWRVKDVAVQLDPDDGRNAHPDRVRRYLEQLFAESQISIYWGSTQDFLEELDGRW